MKKLLSIIIIIALAACNSNTPVASLEAKEFTTKEQFANDWKQLASEKGLTEHKTKVFGDVIAAEEDSVLLKQKFYGIILASVEKEYQHFSDSVNNK